MINFIICDDDSKYLNFMHNIITNYMMKNTMEYKIYEFSDYDVDFMKLVENRLSFKIYIL